MQSIFKNNDVNKNANKMIFNMLVRISSFNPLFCERFRFTKSYTMYYNIPCHHYLLQSHGKRYLSNSRWVTAALLTRYYTSISVHILEKIYQTLYNSWDPHRYKDIAPAHRIYIVIRNVSQATRIYMARIIFLLVILHYYKTTFYKPQIVYVIIM